MAMLDKAARCLSPVSGLESPVASLLLRRLEPRVALEMRGMCRSHTRTNHSLVESIQS